MVRRVAYGEGRNQLVEATVSVVAERGLRGLTFRAIAERAGVNNSLIAHHFGNREALLSSALDWAVERSIQTTDLLELASEHGFADNFLRAIGTMPELQAFQYEMILEARRNELYREPVVRLYNRYHAVVSQSLTKYGFEGDIDATARATFAALDGVVMQYMAGVDIHELRNALHKIWASVHPLLRP